MQTELTLTARAVAVLETSDPTEKALATRRHAALWRDGMVAAVGDSHPPERPGRPDRPELISPTKVKKRKIGTGTAGRAALLHALAHIELNAIDLAWDIVARFAGSTPEPPQAFLDDWVQVADDEAKHFLLLAERLKQLESAYGALPAHDGLWQASQDTAHDLLTRLAIVPMVLEARGLDVTPAMIAKLRAAGDDDSADRLQIIHDDEITHVAAGKRWFDWLCGERGLDPAETWRELVRTNFRGMLKPPFNEDSRAKAGMPPDFYGALV
ncbi:ferritin-like domain-containing protein [Hwanghaeella sp.]|uniref:ferritin-like domain-containing protein n=1 Tax=Hwanghaeella sp. TaxID=2605943 RepID=UPI003CCC3ED0